MRKTSKTTASADAPATTAPGSPERLTPLRELQLVELYRGGGPDAKGAIAELLRAYERRIYSVCFRLVKHHDDACDLTQDTLLKMIESLDSYDGRSKLSTWAIRVAMNCCLSHLRKQKVRSHKSLEETRLPGERAGVVPAAGQSAGPRTGRSEPTPPESVEQSQKRALVLKALDSLDLDSRTILVLRDMQDLDYQQLADVLEIPIGTVKSRLFRARTALRSAIEHLEGKDPSAR